MIIEMMDDDPDKQVVLSPIGFLLHKFLNLTRQIDYIIRFFLIQPAAEAN